jgi:hypothetical protein
VPELADHAGGQGLEIVGRRLLPFEVEDSLPGLTSAPGGQALELNGQPFMRSHHCLLQGRASRVEALPAHSEGGLQVDTFLHGLLSLPADQRLSP